MSHWIDNCFKEAARDYYSLLNRHYPEKPTIKLVGDRYGLSKTQRMALYRGIAAGDLAGQRREKIVHHLSKEFLYIDGYNVFFSIMNYLLGKPVFIANDGFLRDCGEAYGRIPNYKIFQRAMGLTADFLETCRLQGGEIYLDSTNAGILDHLKEWQEAVGGNDIHVKISKVKLADTILISLDNGILATSDSEIIDKSARPLYDLAAAVLNFSFSTTIFCLQEILAK